MESEITFEIEGEHRFFGTDCGDTAKLLGFKEKTVPIHFGQCLLVSQATHNPSPLRITAKSKDGQLVSKEYKVIIEPLVANKIIMSLSLTLAAICFIIL